jgi:hypothetical protein
MINDPAQGAERNPLKPSQRYLKFQPPVFELARGSKDGAHPSAIDVDEGGAVDAVAALLFDGKGRSARPSTQVLAVTSERLAGVASR